MVEVSRKCAVCAEPICTSGRFRSEFSSASVRAFVVGKSLIFSFFVYCRCLRTTIRPSVEIQLLISWTGRLSSSIERATAIQVPPQ
jgi:hypothetical protein